MSRLPEQKTIKGRRLVWRGEPLTAADPLAAWQGLLNIRGVHESDPFFTPKLSDLPDPEVMVDMTKAADRVTKAILNSEHIHVFGDFDADGVSGTAILTEALKAAGAKVTSSIPHRSDDGHGIGVEPVREAAEAGAHLGISVDTGTTCFEACDEAVKLGFDLIVTDHHLPERSPERGPEQSDGSEKLPDAFALLNPAHQRCGFADRKLCGTGVAFFLLMSVWKRLREAGKEVEFDLRSLLDRVAIATVADVMDLVGANRILVFHGLKQLNRENGIAPSVGMQALMKIARVKKSVTVETIGFYLAPRINAAGRMRHGEEAMRMLSTADMDEAMALAETLDETNKQRRLVEADVYKAAELKLGTSEILAVYDEQWHAGVVGLAAGRLARKHGRPAAVGFITPEGQVRVSLRGRPGFHVGDLLNSCSEYLEGFGGHAGAGGGTVKAGSWNGFVAAFGEAVAQQSEHAGDQLTQSMDGVLELGAMHTGLAERLQKFEPVGQANAAAMWLIENVHITENRLLKGGVVRLKVSDGTQWLDAIVFGGGAFGDALERGSIVSLLGQLKLDDYRGNGAVQFVVEDVLVENQAVR
ncbi:MAG: single-stranded-DNA-specific exonuclease RecJ [Mariprofundaceae bacterium]|nr:single-stranded-DNA-specific exonuclease RecJ [Mariprofundaceae bacterium]